MIIDVKEFVRGLGIKDCIDCEKIRRLQTEKKIKVAPLFWQGEGRENIPLVLMGMNPSLVGTDNEPKRGCDFEEYYNYYQNRGPSEKENRKQAQAGGFLRHIPSRHWTMCQNLASQLIREDTSRWKEYVLMEAIHCFFNRAHHLNEEDSRAVAQKCFEKYTKKILLWLKPRMMVLLGDKPYVLLKSYLENEISVYEYCSMTIESLKMPVLRHPHPAEHVKFYNYECYNVFREYCSGFD